MASVQSANAIANSQRIFPFRKNKGREKTLVKNKNIKIVGMRITQIISGNRSKLTSIIPPKLAINSPNELRQIIANTPRYNMRRSMLVFLKNLEIDDICIFF